MITYLYVLTDQATGCELSRWETSIRMSVHGEKAAVKRANDRYLCVAVLTEIKIETKENGYAQT